MPWIESHTLLIGHRKVVGCARELRIKPVYLVGHLHAFWHTVLEQCEDGDITSWDLRFIAEAASWTGDPERFFHALTNSGRPWIDLIPNRELPGVPGKLVHDWLDSAGRYLDSRYRTADPARLCTIWKKHGREYRLNKTQIARIQELSLPTDFPPDPDNPDKITQSVGTRTRTPARTDQNLDSENPGTGDIALHSNQGVGGVPTVAQVAEYISEIKAKDPKAYLNVNPQDEAHAICDKALSGGISWGQDWRATVRTWLRHIASGKFGPNVALIRSNGGSRSNGHPPRDNLRRSPPEPQPEPSSVPIAQAYESLSGLPEDDRLKLLVNGYGEQAVRAFIASLIDSEVAT
jgi:hypothetical protein